MKRILFVIILFYTCLISCEQRQASVYRVTIPTPRSECPVVISDVPLWAQSAIVLSEDREIPSQLDKSLHELSFVSGISGMQDFRVSYSSKAPRRIYPPRVHAQMWSRNPDNSLRAVDTLTSDDEMYARLVHQGPAFESNYVAYRICLNQGQAVDTYGKKSLQLELAETMWDTSVEQRAQGFGCDNMLVEGSIGVGTLNGWDVDSGVVVPVTDFKRREVRILARGPIRTVVEVRVEGWRCCGREITMTSRYILYAGHSDVWVENRIEGDYQGLVFATGVMKTPEGKVLADDGLIATYGHYLSSADVSNPRREGVGLAVGLPVRQIVSSIDTPTDYLCQLRPDARGYINYAFGMFWHRSGWLKNRGDNECLLGLMEEVGRGRMSVLVSRVR